MKLRYKILNVILALLVVGVLSLAILFSYDADCGPPPSLPAGATSMKAIVYRCYGPPVVAELHDVEKPTPKDDEVLVKVLAAAVNPLDWHEMRGEPYLVRASNGFGGPKDSRLGVDFAGTVEAVGRDVTRFKPGDEVFGGRGGAFAQYVAVRESRNVVHKPANLTFEQAAAIPVAAVTALQALRDHGKVQAGQTVLINGASGGVGTYAVQIAKHYGADVTGVCSTRNVELVRSLGADRVIDYKTTDFTQGDERYDLIVDMVGNHGVLTLKDVLQPEGRLVIVGGPGGKWFGPLKGPIYAFFASPFVKQHMGLMLANLTPEDLQLLADLAREGKLASVIDRRYPLSETAQAIAYLEEGRARGKVIITVQ